VVIGRVLGPPGKPRSTVVSAQAGAVASAKPAIPAWPSKNRLVSGHPILPSSIPSSSILIMPWRRPNLAPEDAVTDDRVEQHQREYEETLAPEHEGENGMRCRSFLDRDRERDHVRPERDGQSAERGGENQRGHIERR